MSDDKKPKAKKRPPKKPKPDITAPVQADKPNVKRGGKTPPKGKKVARQKKLTNVVEEITPPPENPMPWLSTEEQIKIGFDLGLEVQWIRLVDVYLTCFNATQSYIEVYGESGSRASMASCASAILNKPNVREYMALRLASAFKRAEDASNKLINHLQMAAYGDVTELVENICLPCRHCHGPDFKYQYTPGEWEQVEEEYERKLAAGDTLAIPPNPKGGTGYNAKLNPHPDCPECFGMGKTKVVMKDTRYMSPAAKVLYRGVQQGKETKMIVASAEKAQEILAKVLKLYEDKTEVNMTITADLEESFQRAMAKSREMQQGVRTTRGGGD